MEAHIMLAFPFLALVGVLPMEQCPAGKTDPRHAEPIGRAACIVYRDDANKATRADKAFIAFVRRDRSVQEIARWWDAQFIYHKPIRIVIVGCGADASEELEVDHPRWGPARHEIYLCTETFAAFYWRYMFATLDNKTAANKNWTESLYFVLLHKLSHSLFRDFKMPTENRDEDSADELPALIIARGCPSLRGCGDAQSWGISYANAAIVRHRFWWIERGLLLQDQRHRPADTHSPDDVRARSIVCIVFGASPSVGLPYNSWERLTPNERRRCADQYPSKRRFWLDMLRQYARVENAERVI